MITNVKSHVLVLGGNFAGLTAARFIHEYSGDAVDITVLDRKPYLIFIPNIGIEVLANRDPSRTMHMGRHKAFYIHSDVWYGGKTSVFKMGYAFYAMKMAFKEMYFTTGGKVPTWGMSLTELVAEKII